MYPEIVLFEDEYSRNSSRNTSTVEIPHNFNEWQNVHDVSILNFGTGIKTKICRTSQNFFTYKNVFQ